MSSQESYKIDFAELEKAAVPLIELMRRKCNQHHMIIVTLEGLEVLSTVMGIPRKM